MISNADTFYRADVDSAAGWIARVGMNGFVEAIQRVDMLIIRTDLQVLRTTQSGVSIQLGHGR